MHPQLEAVPIDPWALAATESESLTVIGGDFGARFDGQLEYHARQKRFLLFANTKYDSRMPAGKHHPRTRFSVAHELGHLFIDSHHVFLRRGGSPHPSRGEFTSDHVMEREADAFAAAVLLPTRLVRPLVNDDELTLDVVRSIAKRFEASQTCTAIRCVELSDFPCALVAIRGGSIAWSVLSSRLIEKRIYPQLTGGTGSPNATRQWTNVAAGDTDAAESSATVGNWFRTYENESLESVHVVEQFLPLPSMATMLALLTIPEDELSGVEDDEED